MATVSQFKVLLVKPPQHGFHSLNSRQRNLPLSLLYLKHCLRDLRCRVDIFDSAVWTSDTHMLETHDLSEEECEKATRHPFFRQIVHFGASWARIRREICRLSPDIIGINCSFSPHCDQAYHVARIAKAASPRSIVVMGGQHVSVCSQHVFENSPADAIILGEAEEVFEKLVRHLSDRGSESIADLDTEKFPGLALRYPSGQISGACRPTIIEKLDRIGFPTLDGINLAAYGNVWAIVTSRGCPFACDFCAVPTLSERNFRVRSVESVLDEIDYLVKNHVRTINIEDDNFAHDAQRADAIMEEICSRGLKVALRFPNGLGIHTMTKERLALFRRAGMEQVLFGLESTGEKVRRDLKKHFVHLDELSTMVGEARARGICAYASMMTGLPVQTLDDIVEDLVEVIMRGLCTSFKPYYPIPGTGLWKRAKDLGWPSNCGMSWYEPLNFGVWTGNFSREDVGSAFLIGLAYSQPGFHRFHRRFLLVDNQHRDDEIIRALRDIGVWVSGKNLSSFVLTPTACRCEYNALQVKPSDRGVARHFDNECLFSAVLLCATLQLWTKSPYSFEEVQCCVHPRTGKCAFEFQKRSERLNRLYEALFARLQERSAAKRREIGEARFAQFIEEIPDTALRAGY